MREKNYYPALAAPAFQRRDGAPMLLPALILMGAVVITAFFLIADFGSLAWKIERPYLIPWVLLTGAVIAAPSAYLIYRKKFNLTHPLVFAAITYFFPVFFLGGWSLTFGLSYYYYLNYVSDPEYNFPLTFVYIMVGYGSLSLGFFIPHGGKIGNYIGRRLPEWEFKPGEVVMSSFVFLIVGAAASLLALEFGQIGYQRDGMIFGETGSLTYYLTLIVPASTFLLWLAFFKFEKWNGYHLIIAAAQILTAVFMLLLLGGRSSLLQSLLLMVFAFTLSGRKFLPKHWLFLGLVLPFCLIFGMIYGTTFRNIKSNADRLSVEEYGTVALETLTSISDKDSLASAGETVGLLGERLEIVSSLAVVVSNYESLQSYEAGYGLENNIWTYTWTAFIPRYVWKDKPLIGDSFSYNELYFDHGSYGLAITSMGDLLRNFGPFGVPAGMIILGFFIRIFYAVFVEGFAFSMWKSTFYMTVLAKISYDSFYGDILPTVIRVAVVIFFQLFILKVIIYALRRQRS